MKREQLVRAHFDAYSDLVWAEDLEPKFRAQGVTGAALEGFRAAWDRYTERRDWEWWQEHTAKTSNATLAKEIEECREEIAAIGLRRQHEKEPNAFERTLKRYAERATPPEKSKDRDIER